jgi:hypothetical protein
MKLVKTVSTYIVNGDEWIVEKCSLPKKKGTQTFYVAESQNNNIAYREKLKKDLINKIKNHKNGKNGTSN